MTPEPPHARAIAPRVLPLIIAMASMACGTWLGLVRLGWVLPLPWPDQLISHGPLMVCGFLGTLIGLERAVALGARWGFVAPILIAAGALTLDIPVTPMGPLLITCGSAAVVAIFAVLLGRRPTLDLATMAGGAIVWAIGNTLWLAGAPIFRVVGWWIAFLVLTIAGERLELNRVLRPTPGIRAAFVGSIAILLGGMALSTRWPDAGVRMLGVGLIAVAVWLVRYDVARRTVRQRGITRFMALGLLSGYVWLLAGGIVATASGVATPGVVYDAMLHAVFLGFVMSMVFAHAPVIFPAVLGVPLTFRPRFYAHLGVLHLSVVVRLTGDLVEALARWRYWGGLLNAAALAMFVGNTAWSIAAQKRSVNSTYPKRDESAVR